MDKSESECNMSIAKIWEKLSSVIRIFGNIYY